MTREIPTSSIDMFGHDAVRDARAVDDGIRELAPVVWLERESICVLGRHEHVTGGLSDWQAFSNAPGPGTIRTPCGPRSCSRTTRRATPRCRA